MPREIYFLLFLAACVVVAVLTSCSGGGDGGGPSDSGTDAECEPDTDSGAEYAPGCDDQYDDEILATDIAAFPNGDIAITGALECYAELDLGGGPLLHNGPNGDFFLAKFDGDGKHLWSKSFPGTPYNMHDGEIPAALSIDGSNSNVTIVGGHRDTTDFGGGELVSAGGTDAFVATMDHCGEHLWSASYGGPGEDGALDVAIDPSGGIAVVGFVTGIVDFGGSSIGTADGPRAFVLRLDPIGNHVWSLAFDGTGYQRGNGVAIDNEGNIIVVGEFWESANFGGQEFHSADENDIFIVKLDSDGSHLWSAASGGSHPDRATSVAVDSEDRFTVFGSFFSGPIDFGIELDSPGAEDLFVIRFDQSNDHLWSLAFGGDMPESAAMNGLAVDEADGVVLAGGFRSTIDFGGESISNEGSFDSFVARLTGDGDHVWSDSFGGSAYEAAHAVTVDDENNAFAIGGMRFTSTQEIFISKHSSDGNVEWYDFFSGN